MRKIIHLDMDAFFASVEMRDNPKLQNVPMAVGGAADRRGVIATSNYLARKYGVRSAMSTAHALKLCPQLVIVRGQGHKYREASKQVFEIFRDYTELIEPVSLDEAYLDVTNVNRCFNSATWMAQEIRQKVFQKTKLTISAGISVNKLIAKMASDINKPNGQFTVAPEQVDNFIKTVPVEKLWGVGKVTAGHLHELGIKTCLDLQSFSHSDLVHHFGKYGEVLYNFCRGIDERAVETDWERKSLGTEETYDKDIHSYAEMKVQLVKLVEELRESLKAYTDREIKNLHVKIKYHDFKQTTIERQLPFSEENFIDLLEERWCQDPRPVRLLGVGVKFLEEAHGSEGDQLPLLTEA